MTRISLVRAAYAVCVAASTVSSPALAAKFFTDARSYAAATRANVTYNFENIAAPNSFLFLGNSSYLLGPVTIDPTTGNSFIIDGAFHGSSAYGKRDFYANQFTQSTIFRFPGSRAFSISPGSFANAGTPLIVTLSDGSSVRTTFPSQTQQIAFLGFTSSVDIRNVTITNTAGTTTDIIEFSLGEVSAVPEPVSWAMMVAGFAFVGMGVRQRRRLLPAF